MVTAGLLIFLDLADLPRVGQLDRAWCEKEIETLKKQGKLKVSGEP